MRTLHWLFLVSVLLFISGIGFVIAAGRTARSAPVVTDAAAPAVLPVATVKHVMRGMTMPAAAALWDSVSTIVDAEGVHENRPRTDEEWAAVAASAAVLAESATLLVTGDRAIDKGEWVKMAAAMSGKAKEALAFAEKKDPEGILTVGEEINVTCDTCHERYSRE